MAKQNILILGADGFIGSNLALALQKENKYKIFAFDLFRDGISRNLKSFDENLVMVQGNFLNKGDLKKALKKIDYVFHFISLTTPGSSAKDPFIDIETNVTGTIRLLKECVSAKVKKVIFSSTGGAIYGNQENDNYLENTPTDPISPYAIGKLTIEKYFGYFYKQFGLKYLILRYSNPFGPHQNIVGNQGVIPIFLNLIKQNKAISIYGDGNIIRDFIFIDDAIYLTKEMFTRNLKHNLYNIGCGHGTSILKLIMILEKATQKKVKIRRLPKRLIDVEKIVLNTKRIESEFPKYKLTSLETGIKKTWVWINNQDELI